ncbi:MAG: replication protein [Armatimonadetes bacterium]|nr:replication protein [Armatimonadota bacterium]
MDDGGKGYRFSGFRSPRYTQVPDEAFDELMGALTPAEFKVMMYVIRRTFGFKKDSDAISLSQIVSGVRTMDGRVLDRGTGLSKSGAVKAIKGLLEKQVVVTVRRTSANHGHEATVYQLHFAEDGAGRPSDRGPSRSPLVHSEDKGALSTQKTSPCAPGAQALVHSPDIQETVRQETEQGSLSDLAAVFLANIGYAKPSRAKSERTLRILQRLHVEDEYSLEVIHTACRIAASMGARGPELIPHVIGRQEPPPAEPGVGKRLAQAEEEARARWETQAARFDSLPEGDKQELIRRAKASNPIIAQRPGDHPLVRAAAIALLGG